MNKKEVYERQVVQHSVDYKEFTVERIDEHTLNDVVILLTALKAKYGDDAKLMIDGSEYETNAHITYMAPETQAQYDRRIKYYEQDVEWEATAKKTREENELKTYERLKKKFDKKS